MKSDSRNSSFLQRATPLRLAYDEHWAHYCFVGGKLFDWDGNPVTGLGVFAAQDFNGKAELRPKLWVGEKRVRISYGAFEGLQPEFSKSVQTIWARDGKGEWLKRENDVAYQVTRLVPYQTRYVYHPEEENSSMRITLTMRSEWIVERRVHVPYYHYNPVISCEHNYVRTVASKVWGMKEDWIRDPSAIVSS